MADSISKEAVSPVGGGAAAGRYGDASAEAVAIITREGLLPEGLRARLHALWPQYSRLGGERRQLLFTGKAHYTGLTGFREVCAILRQNGIDIGHQDERELFVDVYRFLATRHTLNSIDWSNFAKDSLFQLVFPQPGMIRQEVVAAYCKATSREQRERIAAAHMRDTNPHDGHQQLNKPWYDDDDGEQHVLEGSQHKYPQVQLIFDKTTQHCFSFCTYCFRHAQVRGDEDMFVQQDVAEVHDYLRKHREVNDILITGGDAGYMPADRFEQYITPLLEDPSLFHVKTVRLGSRALTYEPELLLREKYGRLLGLFERLYDNGIQMAWMAHFSTPQEVLNPLTIAAIRRLQRHHVVVRSQSPIMRHISMFEGPDGRIDVDRSAQNWIDLGTIFGCLNIGFHSIYCPRPTGEHHYFTAPLAELHQVYDKVYRSLPSINRPNRHLSMTTSAGKISILGTAEVHGEKLFALKFSEGRNMAWLDQVFLARYDEKTNNVALLQPYDNAQFFFAGELKDIEARLAAVLGKAASAGRTGQ
jgi:L-lysine 2,3-aminomutase